MESDAMGASCMRGCTSASPGYSTPEKAGTGNHKRARTQCGGGSDFGSSPRTPSGAVPAPSSDETSGRAGSSPVVSASRAKRQIAPLLGTDPVEVAKQDCPTHHSRGRENDATKAEPLDGADWTSCTDVAACDRANHVNRVSVAAPAAARAGCAGSRTPAEAAEARECAGGCAAEPGLVPAKPAAAAVEPAETAAVAAAAAEVLWRALLAMDKAGRRRAIQDRQMDEVEWTGAVWHDEMEMRFYRRPSHPPPPPNPTSCSDSNLRTRASLGDRPNPRRRERLSHDCKRRRRRFFQWGTRLVVGPRWGSGGFADVYPAIDRETGQAVALKRFKTLQVYPRS
jgi:hypothetical protein